MSIDSVSAFNGTASKFTWKRANFDVIGRPSWPHKYLFRTARHTCKWGNLPRHCSIEIVKRFTVRQMCGDIFRSTANTATEINVAYNNIPSKCIIHELRVCAVLFERTSHDATHMTCMCVPFSEGLLTNAIHVRERKSENSNYFRFWISHLYSRLFFWFIE